jgi:hypothetical protein
MQEKKKKEKREQNRGCIQKMDTNKNRGAVGAPSAIQNRAHFELFRVHVSRCPHLPDLRVTFGYSACDTENVVFRSGGFGHVDMWTQLEPELLIGYQRLKSRDP